MEGYSGSDVKLVCKEAAMRSVRKIFGALEAGDKGLSRLGPRPGCPSVAHFVSSIQEVLTRQPSSWSP